ncbi:MAG: DUF134 domain-containing protein [Bacteroidales bacterium]
MSPRLKKLRKVLSPPNIKGFKPYGPDVKQDKLETVEIHIEEYEALKLCDYDKYNHHQASAIMGVSRPTFSRIYASVRQKIALAFAEGKQIAIEGGKVYFDSDWYSCKGCGCYFNNPQRDVSITECPLCGSKKFSQYDIANNPEEREGRICNDFCICPECGHEKPHQFGKPCSQEVCPECNSPLKRKGRSTRYRNLNC